MKIKSILALFVATTVFSSATIAQEYLDCAVVSDIHIMSPSLLKTESKAFDRYIAHDRKLLRQGPLLLRTAIQQLLQQSQRPKVVLIPGDLTKDGELVSHQLVADTLLNPLREAGIKVYVIPGNHDVNNPHAVCFSQDSTRRTATVTAKDFAHIYRDYGYGEAIARDPYSLSYVVQLSDSLRLIAIDACRYQDNDFSRNICVTGGRIQPQTLAFIEQQASAARKSNCKLIGMMHHGLVSHWKWQDRVMGDYLVKDWKRHAKAFARMGIHIVFTGHFHAQDIASYGKGKQQVYDIETGSTVSYPMPVRYVRLNTDRIDIHTSLLCQSDMLPDAKQLEAEAIRYARASVNTLIAEMLTDKVPADVQKQVSNTFSEAYVAHLAGDEAISENYLDTLKEACRQLRPYSWKYAFALKRIGRYLFTDQPPGDNRVTLHF